MHFLYVFYSEDVLYMFRTDKLLILRRHRTILLFKTKYTSRKMSSHGITNFQYNSWNISTTSWRHPCETATWHKQYNILGTLGWRYNTTKTNPDLINTHINQIHTDIQLNSAYENNSCISFLDLHIIRKTSNLEIDIHWKPTTTDTTMNFCSNHPMEHKVAVYKHHITRMHSLPLTPNRKQKEWKIIQLIAQNNNFPQTLLQTLNLQIQYKHTNQDHIKGKHKHKTWTIFTY